jgi:hypothetical protein
MAIKLDGLSWTEYKPQAAELQNREFRVKPLGGVFRKKWVKGRQGGAKLHIESDAECIEISGSCAGFFRSLS